MCRPPADGPAYVMAVLLLLTRETAVLALVPLVLLALRARQYRQVIVWSSTTVPLLLWYGWLRYRMGCWPFLDPAITVNQPLRLAVAGLPCACVERLRPSLARRPLRWPDGYDRAGSLVGVARPIAVGVRRLLDGARHPVLRSG